HLRYACSPASRSGIRGSGLSASCNLSTPMGGFHRYQKGSGARYMTHEAQHRQPLQQPQNRSLEPPAAGRVYESKAVHAVESQWLEKIAQAVEAEPVDSRILGIVCDGRVGRDGETLTVPLELTGVPTVQRQIEFLLFRTEHVCRAQIQQSVRAKNARRLTKA